MAEPDRRLPVLTAIADPDLEAAVAGAVGTERRLVLGRRCVDLADLLAAAQAGLGRVAVLTADLAGLDRAAVERLHASGVAVLGFAPPPGPDPRAAGDTGAGQRLADCGVRAVATSLDRVAGALLALPAPSAPRFTFSGPDPLAPGTPRPAAGSPAGAAAGPPAAENGPADRRAGVAAPQPPGPGGQGTVVAVWGPGGAPGRSVVALGLAAEAAAAGRVTLLIDADVYGGVQAQLLGILDEGSGLLAAVRAADDGGLDAARLAGCARDVGGGLAVLTGLPTATRWPELRPPALLEVVRVARELADVVVVDLAGPLETDEELSYDTRAPRRHGATLAALADADLVLAVGAADPVGLTRLVRGVQDLRALALDAPPVLVLNKVRRGGADDAAALLARHLGQPPIASLPLDVAACDTAVAGGRTLPEAVPASPLRLALRALAAQLFPTGAPQPRRGRVPAAQAS